jgi:hypothetical protein
MPWGRALTPSEVTEDGDNLQYTGPANGLDCQHISTSRAVTLAAVLRRTVQGSRRS